MSAVWNTWKYLDTEFLDILYFLLIAFTWSAVTFVIRSLQMRQRSKGGAGKLGKGMTRLPSLPCKCSWRRLYVFSHRSLPETGVLEPWGNSGWKKSWEVSSPTLCSKQGQPQQSQSLRDLSSGEWGSCSNAWLSSQGKSFLYIQLTQGRSAWADKKLHIASSSNMS